MAVHQRPQAVPGSAHAQADGVAAVQARGHHETQLVAVVRFGEEEKVDGRWGCEGTTSGAAEQTTVEHGKERAGGEQKAAYLFVAMDGKRYRWPMGRRPTRVMVLGGKGRRIHGP